MILDTAYARWKLNELNTVTTLIDSSGNGRNAITTSTKNDLYYKKNARKIETSQNIQSNDVLVNSTNFTLSTVYKLNVNSTHNTYLCPILGITSNAAYGIYIGVTTNNQVVLYYFNNSHVMVNTGYFLKLDEWVHLTLKKEDLNASIYLNGKLLLSQTIPSFNAGISFNTCYMNGTTPTNARVNGSYYDIVLYDRALSNFQISELYEDIVVHFKTLLTTNNTIFNYVYHEPKYNFNMTSNVLPAPYVVTASSIYSNGYDSYKAFNGTNLNASDAWLTKSGETTGWIQIDTGSKKIVNSFTITARGTLPSATPKDFTLLGSNNGVNFTILQKVYESTNWLIDEKRKFNFDNLVPYRYYRLEITNNNGYATYTSIALIELENRFSGVITEVPDLSSRNFRRYGNASYNKLDFSYNTKRYIAQGTTTGLWKKQINKKPYFIKLVNSPINVRMAFQVDTNYYTIDSNGSLVQLADGTAATIKSNGFREVNITSNMHITIGDNPILVIYNDTLEDIIIETIIDANSIIENTNTIDTYFYTNSDITEAKLKSKALIAPLNELEGDIEVLTYDKEVNDNSKYQLTTNIALKNSEIVYPVSDISIAGVETIDILNLNGSNCKVAVSFNSGLSWHTYKSGNWVTIQDASLGMTPSELMNLSSDKINSLRNNSDTIRFSYYLTKDSIVDNLEMKVTMKGTETLASTSSYDFSYDVAKKTITYNIKKNGTYSVNYIDSQ